MLKTQFGYIVDTPGFSSFELPMIKSELAENYPGFTPYLGKCYFNDCIHLSEHRAPLNMRLLLVSCVTKPMKIMLKYHKS